MSFRKVLQSRCRSWLAVIAGLIFLGLALGVWFLVDRNIGDRDAQNAIVPVDDTSVSTPVSSAPLEPKAETEPQDGEFRERSRFHTPMVSSRAEEPFHAIHEFSDIEYWLDELQAHNDWDSDQLRDASMPWANACRRAQRTSPEASVESSAALDTALTYVVRLRDFCLDFAVPESASSEELASHGGWSSPVPYELAWTLEHEGSDRAKEQSMAMLDRGLRQFNEGQVRYVLQFLAGVKGMLRSPYAGDSRNYSVRFIKIADTAAAALLCQELGGCQGGDHPIVLRECVKALDRDAWCLEPRDIHEAIYQTLTPLEFGLFQSMLDQVNAMLYAYRRNQ